MGDWNMYMHTQRGRGDMHKRKVKAIQHKHTYHMNVCMIHSGIIYVHQSHIMEKRQTQADNIDTPAGIESAL